MKRVRFEAGALELSALGFGTASFSRRTSRRQNLRILDAAFDAGITHFDTARLYGTGTAERVVATFLRERKSSVTIATKVGLFPPSFVGVALAWARFGDARGRRSFAVADVRASLEASLRALRTDAVDLLLLHECRPEDVTDDLVAFLEEAKRRGLARAVGTATDERSTAALLARKLTFPEVVQLPASLLDRRPLRREGRPMILHSVLAHDLARVRAHLGKDPAHERRWSSTLAIDCSRPENVAGILLQRAVAEWPTAVVLVSSRAPEHVRAAAEAVTRPLLADELFPHVDRLLSEARAAPTIVRT